MASTATESTTSWNVYSFHLTFCYSWSCSSSRPLVSSSIIGLRSSVLAIHLQSRLLSPAASCVLYSMRTSGSNPCLPPHLDVAIWLAEVMSCLTRCCMDLRVGCTTIVLSGTASILSITILLIAVMIAAIFAPFVR